VYYGQAYSDQMPTPTKLGYGFDGWYTEQTSGTKITAATTCKLTADQTLYAHWKAKKYMVSFDANGGTCEWSAKEYTYNQKLGELPTPTRKGYSFNGWFTDKNGGSMITDETVMTYTSNVTIYAHWTPVFVKVTFDPNGGTCSTESKELQYELAYGSLPTPSYPEHEFTGWFSEKQGGNQVTNDSIVEIENDFTLYAQWKSIVFSVSFNSNGGECGTASKRVTYGKAYGSLPTPTNKGYIFDGWYTEITDGKHVNESDIFALSENTTLYAHWIARTFTVTFDPAGGICHSNSKVVTYGETYGNLPTPTRTGYYFADWRDKTSENLITNDTIVNLEKDTTLVALWNPNEYTVTFDANGGTCEMRSMTVKYGQAYSAKMPIPARADCDFDGWYTSVSGGTKIVATTKYEFVSNQTLYAHWKAKKEIIDYGNCGNNLSWSLNENGTLTLYGTGYMSKLDLGGIHAR